MKRLLLLVGMIVIAAGCQPTQPVLSSPFPTASTSSSPTTVPSPDSTGSCGAERWAVKTGTDADAGSVNLNPITTTVAALGAMPAPVLATSRLDQEKQTYTVVATLVAYKLEADSDFHLQLSEDGSTMIAEIPDPQCAQGSVWVNQITQTRDIFLEKYRPTTSWQSANIIVTVTGVLFFDFPHGQSGAAPNYVELHPVLSISFGG